MPRVSGWGCMKFRASLFFLLSVSVGLSVTPSLAQSQPDVTALFRCPVTVPNGNEPPEPPPSKVPAWMAERNREGVTLRIVDPRPDRASFHGNGKLWTALPPQVLPGGVIPEEGDESARAVQIAWWQMGDRLLTIKGTRLDGPTVPPNQWHLFGRHETATVIFPTQGCWEITMKIHGIDDSALTFVVKVRGEIPQP
jgi:hypothetical protein